MIYRDQWGRFAKKPVEQPVKVEQDTLQTGLLDLIARVKKRGATGTCSYGIAFEKTFDNNVGDVCHARMRWVKRVNLGSPVGAYEFVLASDHPGHEDTLRQWFHFMANESPFANSFLSKDAEDMVNNGILYNIDEGFSRVVSAAIATRLFHEFGHTVPIVFKMLYNEFKDRPGLLYTLVYCASSDRRLRLYEYGHSAFTYSFTTVSLQKHFLNGVLPPAVDKPFRQYGTGYQIFDSIGVTAYGEKHKTLGSVIRNLAPPARAFGSKGGVVQFDFIDAFIKEITQ